MAERLNLPELPKSSMFIGEEKTMTIEWQEFFRILFKRIGGATGPNSIDISLSEVAEAYSTPVNYNKRIDELERKLQTLTEPASYSKRISELEKQILALTEPVSYDKRISELEKQILALTEPVSYDKRISELEKQIQIL